MLAAQHHQCRAAALAQSRTLTELDMPRCSQETITDVALDQLSRCATLTQLILSRYRQSSLSAAGAGALTSSRSLRILDVTYATVGEQHAALLGESASVRLLLLSIPSGQQPYIEWVRAHSALLHAPRLADVDLYLPCGVRCSPDAVQAEAEALLLALQEARPAAMKERRVAAAVADAADGADWDGTLTISLCGRL
jgi:hypothetical protein